MTSMEALSLTTGKKSALKIKVSTLSCRLKDMHLGTIYFNKD